MPMSVLVADDSTMSRKLVIKALPEQWNAEVRQAANGLEALEICRKGLADVLFLDLTMPVMDGLEALEHIHAEDLNTLVIVISADIQPKSQQKVMSLGALAFLKKPLNADELHDVLRKQGLL